MNNEKYSTSQESIDFENHAREIAQCGDFEKISKQLSDEDLFPAQVERMHEIYAESLENADFMTQRDWELITIIDLFSPELATHSVETYTLVHSKIQHIQLGTETIEQTISGEVESLNTFYRACLFHDIGKILIPKSILNNAMQSEDWEVILRTALENTEDTDLLKKVGLSQEIDKNTINISEVIEHLQARPDSLIPVHQILNEDEVAELEKRGFSADRSFREIIEAHELASMQTLLDEGMVTEASIVKQHHNYQHENYDHPISSQTIGIGADLVDLLHLADVEQALLSSNRSYKNSFSRLSALEILVKDAEKGVINKRLTALWVRDELAEMKTNTESDKDYEKMEYIKSFIEQNIPTISSDE